MTVLDSGLLGPGLGHLSGLGSSGGSSGPSSGSGSTTSSGGDTATGLLLDLVVLGPLGAGILCLDLLLNVHPSGLLGGGHITTSVDGSSTLGTTSSNGAIGGRNTSTSSTARILDRFLAAVGNGIVQGHVHGGRVGLNIGSNGKGTSGGNN